MITTIDKAGRMVIPAQLRDEVGLTPGEVRVTVQGARVILEQPTSKLREVDGHLLLPVKGESIHDDDLRELRLVDQR